MMIKAGMERRGKLSRMLDWQDQWLIFRGGEEGGGRRERKRRDKNGRRGKRKRKKKTNIFEGLAYESLLNLFPFSGEKIYSEKLKELFSPRSAGRWLRRVSNLVLFDSWIPSFLLTTLSRIKVQIFGRGGRMSTDTIYKEKKRKEMALIAKEQRLIWGRMFEVAVWHQCGTGEDDLHVIRHMKPKLRRGTELKIPF